MDTELRDERRYYVQPGYIYRLPAPAIGHAVVGSSVSVCVWDRVLKYGAMNHFLFPETWDARRATPLYGNVATAELVRMMLEVGSRREDLSAQILGGASPGPGSPVTLGCCNADAARRALGRSRIHISSEDTGGYMGRKVVFDTGTGHLLVLKVHRLREEDWGEAGA